MHVMSSLFWYEFICLMYDIRWFFSIDRVKSAFSANLHKHLSKMQKHTKVIFGTVITNIGVNYDKKKTGVFTSPRHGTFYFSWTMFTNPGGSCPTELVKNGNSVGLANLTWNEGSKWNHSSTQSGVRLFKKMLYFLVILYFLMYDFWLPPWNPLTCYYFSYLL